MKKLLMVGLVSAMLMLTACDGVTPDIQNNSLMQPTAEYELDTWMENSEVYEFTPVTHTGKTCVVFIPDNMGSVAMQCFNKPEVTP